MQIPKRFAQSIHAILAAACKIKFVLVRMWYIQRWVTVGLLSIEPEANGKEPRARERGFHKTAQPISGWQIFSEPFLRNIISTKSLFTSHFLFYFVNFYTIVAMVISTSERLLLRDRRRLQNGWNFEKVPNGLWPHPPPLIFGKSYCGFRDKIATKVRMLLMAGLL